MTELHEEGILRLAGESKGLLLRIETSGGCRTNPDDRVFRLHSMRL
jgi:hypothetical protein